MIPRTMRIAKKKYDFVRGLAKVRGLSPSLLSGFAIMTLRNVRDS